MSNFQCSECGMTNIDCGKEGYKTPREIQLEEEVKIHQKFIGEIKEKLLNYLRINDPIWCLENAADI